MLEENSIELSPLPIPTGAPAMPIKSCISANDVYIDVAAKKSDEEILLFQERLQRVFLLSNTVSLVVFIVLFKERLGYSQTLSEHLLETASKPWLWFSAIPGALIITFMVLNAARRNFSRPLIRFNRQRR
jgi:hypothetical protein